MNLISTGFGLMLALLIPYIGAAAGGFLNWWTNGFCEKTIGKACKKS
jgi:hypothetical protein